MRHSLDLGRHAFLGKHVRYLAFDQARSGGSLRVSPGPTSAEIGSVADDFSFFLLRTFLGTDRNTRALKQARTRQCNELRARRPDQARLASVR